MKGFDYDLGILGGGSAGLTAAAGGARFGAKTILIEKGDALGGDCLHTGCVPSKSLIRTANVLTLARRFREFGLPEIQSFPPVDLGAVMDSVHKVVETIQKHDSPEHFCSLGAEIVFGSPVFIDDHTVEVSGRRITSRFWIIATGSHPTIPAIEGLDLVPYWTNENLFHQRNLPRRLIVLGGGSIGSEMAQAFTRLGSKVIVVEYTDQILGHEDADVAGMILEHFTDEGMEIHTSTTVVRTEYTDGTIRLHLTPAKGGGPEHVIESDALLVATGRTPTTGGMNLEAAGVEYSSRGIPTDERMRTNIRHIYACGDVNGKMPFTHAAGYEAGVALTNAILHLPRKADYAKIGWSTFTDPELASIGLNEKRAKKEGISYRVYAEEFRENDRAQAERETSGMIKLLVDDHEGLLGCQIIGPHAGELIHEWVIALSNKVKIRSLAGDVHLYPTLSEISKRVAGDVYAGKVFSKLTKDVLKLLFNFKGRACRLPDENASEARR